MMGGCCPWRFLLCREVERMMVSCRYCGRVHKRGDVCQKKPRGCHRKGKPTRADKFRRTKAWQKTREQVLERDYHMCRVCFEGRYGTFPLGKLQVHHIVPLAEDYRRRLELGNLITLCPLHHRDAEDGKISREELAALAGSPPRWGEKY